MRITSKIIVLLMSSLLSIGFVACSDDDDTSASGGKEIPEFVLGQESIKVKIGAENKVTVDIKQGGGEYNAFILDASIAKVEVENGVIKVEGLANGQTSLIISDKYNRYRKLPVSVYTTDKLQLSHEQFDMLIPLGWSKKITENVVLGNGGYEATSDNPDVAVSVDEAGEISITAISKKSAFTANVIVTDCTNLTSKIAVTVKPSFEPFTVEELEAIKADNNRRYFWGNTKTNGYGTFVNTVKDDGKLRYGWIAYDYYFHYIDFKGGKAEGVKEDATVSINISFFGLNESYTDQAVTLSIIKNDGTNIWGVYSFVDEENEKLNFGYFCDTINPK